MLRRTILAAAAPGRGASLLAEDGSFEKTIPFPRTAARQLDWTTRSARSAALRLRNYPDDEDIEKARAKDPNDTSWLWWQFNVDNRGPEKFKIKLVGSRSSTRTGRSSRRATAATRSTARQSTSPSALSTRMKTLDIADAPKVRLRAADRPEKR